jgi:hypothetical protein
MKAHGICEACGGKVDESGFADGGEVGSEEIEVPENESAEYGDPEDFGTSEQNDTVMAQRDAAFASAIKSGFSKSTVTEHPDDMAPKEQNLDEKTEEDDLSRRKREHYGWKKGA